MKTKVQLFPHKNLTTPTIHCVSVPDDNDVANDLFVEITAAKRVLNETPQGLALASNQVSTLKSPHRFFVVESKFAKKNSLPTVIINPSCVPFDTSLTAEDEGCLSFPGLRIVVGRHNTIRCQFWDQDWKSYTMLLTGMAARMFQHECEHLDGETFLKHLPRIQRFQVLGRYKNAR